MSIKETLPLERVTSPSREKSPSERETNLQRTFLPMERLPEEIDMPQGEVQVEYIVAAGGVFNSKRIRGEPRARWNERMAFEHYIRTRYYENEEVLEEAGHLSRYHVNMMFDGARYEGDIEALVMEIRSIR